MDDDPEALNEFTPRTSDGRLDFPVIVWLYKASPTDELRYSIRSLTNCIPNDGIVIVGDRPRWFTGHHIKARTSGDVRENTWESLRIVANDDSLPEHIVITNDDMFMLNPVPAAELHHRGPLDDTIKRMRRTRHASPYTRSLVSARSILDYHEISGPHLDYEAHTPFPVTRTAIREALEIRDAHRDLKPAKRTLIGNVAGLRGRLIDGPVPGTHDVKVKSLREGGPTGIYLSTNERTWRDHYASVLERHYPKPSRWER